ncbi:MAG: hypothetical protein ACHQVK_00050 [Candidatus Paceibacterales bacterium]
MFKTIASKIGLGLASIVGIIGGVAHAQLSTSTLGTAIDTVNSTWYGYFLVLLTNYWPFIVGVGVLIVVWHFGRRALNAFS